MPNDNLWLENRVAELLRDLKRSGFFQSGIEDAQHLQRTYGYVWDVALKLACDYWCR